MRDQPDVTRPQHVGHEVYRDANDPNMVVIVNHMKDLDSAKRYAGSDALRSAMGRAGVQGPPEVTFLTDAEARHYWEGAAG